MLAWGLVLIGMHLVSKLEPRPTEPVVLTTERLMQHVVFTGAGHRPGCDSHLQSATAGGIWLEVASVRWQVMDGIFGYLLALLPMAA